jgi:hypothetical protein
MSIVFYPQVIEGATLGTLDDKVELIMEAAQRYKAVMMEAGAKNDKVIVAPKDITVSFNWDLIAMVLREVRELPEAERTARMAKADLLTKLAEIYEVLRAAKMPRLEAVRIALMSEAGHLRGGSSTQVA